jgi:outer membrane lipase/esterase
MTPNTPRLPKAFAFCRAVASAFAAAVLLASCGGGTTQIEPFAPDRFIAFGDEYSVLTATDPVGRKYSVNALNSAGTAVDCTGFPLWIQVVANVYDFDFAECPVGTTDAKAVTRAAAGARAQELVTQIDAQEALGFNDKDLVSVLVGANDVKEIYESRTDATTEQDMLDEARLRGVLIADQVNRLVALGAKVLIATAPDVGLSPYALAKGSADAALLSRLSAALNGRIRVNILNDGRFVGLVLADEMVQAAVRVPSAYGLTNVIAAVCDPAKAPALTNCTKDTLITDGNGQTFLWADTFHFGVTAQRQLGSLAAARAQNNPF